MEVISDEDKKEEGKKSMKKNQVVMLDQELTNKENKEMEEIEEKFED
jgi:hypothetical protein